MASSEDGWPALLHLITLKAKMAVCNTSVKGDSGYSAGFLGVTVGPEAGIVPRDRIILFSVER